MSGMWWMGFHGCFGCRKPQFLILLFTTTFLLGRKVLLRWLFLCSFGNRGGVQVDVENFSGVF
jgi:hypothetical protein